MITYITYANGDNYVSKTEQNMNYMSSFFDNSILYKKQDIDRNFLLKNDKILSYGRGDGCWLWKPYFILKTLRSINYGDTVFYLDAGDYMYRDISEYINNTVNNNDGFFLVENNHKNSTWTKKDCFILMNCDTEYYHNKNQLEAGCCAFTKNEKTLKFVEEWLNYGEKYEIIADEYINSNYVDFIDHRFDQSILTNLYLKENIRSVNFGNVSSYIIFNHIKFI